MKNSIDRDNKVLKIILIEGSINLLVVIFKGIVGFSSGSLAVIGDAIHSLTDVANNVVAWVVIRFSRQPADKEHPYGHRKFETLAVFGLATLLTLFAFELALSALKRQDSPVQSETWEIIVMMVVLTLNIFLSIWQRKWAKKLESDILMADASHTLSDVLTTLVVIIGWQLSAMGYVWLDRICALGVAAIVFYLAFGLFKKAVPSLVDEFAVEPEELTTMILKVSGVKKVERVRSRWIGSNRAVDLVILVDPQLSTQDSHKITDEIEMMLETNFEIKDISIHVEPDVN